MEIATLERVDAVWRAPVPPGGRFRASCRISLAGCEGGRQTCMRPQENALPMHFRSNTALALFLTVFLLLPRTPGRAEETHAITQDELVRRTQELYDAVAPGDQTPWKKYYAGDCIYHDEKGRGFDKAQLLADVTPMPNGYSGTIKVVHPESLITRDCAILSYDSDETETIFGQEMHARYHGIDTWLWRDGEWRIAASQVMRYYEDPVRGQSDPAKFAAYAGTYALEHSERRTVVSTENGQLFMERTGGQKTLLYPESGAVFFRKGVEGRMLFRCDADGKVDAMIDRRNNEDVVWKRM